MILLKGDCLIEMDKIADGGVDMILADLPYGTTSCKWDNVIPFEPLWKHYWRVLKPNGAVVLFGSEPFSSHLRMSQIKHYKYDWVWEKTTASNFATAKYQPLKQHEYIAVFYRKTCGYFPIMEQRQGSGKKRIEAGYKSNPSSGETTGFSISLRCGKNYSDLRYPKSVQTFNNKDPKERGLHPTQKPVTLLEYLIKTYTLEGETVLDNTMGSGSTGVACVNTGRQFIGIEQDEKYFAIAQKRIAEAQKPQELWNDT